MDGLGYLGAVAVPARTVTTRAATAAVPQRPRGAAAPFVRSRGVRDTATVVPPSAPAAPSTPAGTAAVPVRTRAADGVRSAFKPTTTSSAGPNAVAAGQRAVAAAQRIASKFRRLSPAVAKAGQAAIAAGNKAIAAAKSVPAIAGVVLGHLNLDFLGADYTEEQQAANATMIAEVAGQAAEAAAEAQARMDAFYQQAQAVQSTADPKVLGTATALLAEGDRLCQQFDIGPGIWGPEAKEAFADRKAAMDGWAQRMETVLAQLTATATPAPGTTTPIADGGAAAADTNAADTSASASGDDEGDYEDDGAFPDPYADPYGGVEGEETVTSDAGGSYLFAEAMPVEPDDDMSDEELIEAEEGVLYPELSDDTPETFHEYGNVEDDDGLALLGFDWTSLARGAAAGLDQAGNLLLTQNAGGGRAADGGLARPGQQPPQQQAQPQPQPAPQSDTFRTVAIAGGVVGGLALVGGLVARLLRKG